MSTKSEQFDALIVGSGFGGAACGHALARAGLRVLLLERGDWVKRDALDWDQREILVRKRYQSDVPMQVKQYGDRDFQPVYPNEVVGGMSVFYGGASLRLRETDFGQWPIAYGDLEPYYSRAEALLEVHGESGADGCEPERATGYPFPGIELTPPARRIFDAGVSLGYRPFRIPLAINFTHEARTICVRCITCDGFPCRIEAKNDVATTLLREAQSFGLQVMANVVVGRLIEEHGHIRSIVCVDRQTRKAFPLSAPLVVVSAGALDSPPILLRSHLERFPQHRLIGRYLMRHCNGVVAGVFPFRTNPEQVFHKQLCFTDFYEDLRTQHGRAVGVIQDIYTPAPEVIKHFAPVGTKHIAALAARYMQNLLCIAEDEPLYENAVGLSGETDVYGLEIARVVHRYTQADCERRDYLVARARQLLRRAGSLGAYCYPIDTFSHAVGTLRMGTAPEDSVLDAHCRFWGIDNLYVVDGCFMPTSCGVNPSLTIAANALRVADDILKQR